MPELSTDAIRDLATDAGFPRVTVHTPMERAGRNVQKNRIYLKNAAAAAANMLMQRGLEEDQAAAFVKPIREMGEDDATMQHQLGGMSVFVDENEMRVIELPERLPQIVEVGDRFSILELLHPALDNRDYAVLTLSLGGVGLYRATRHSAKEVELAGLPEDLCYVLRFDQFEKSVQQHTTSGGVAGGTGTGAGKAAVAYHGHGAGKDEHERFVSRFIEAVEPLVTAYMERHSLPLVLIGVEEVVGHYRKRTSYHRIVEKVLHVDPHTLDLDDVIRLGWECMSPRVEAAKREQIERYRSHGNTVRGIHAVLPAVAEGRAEVLFVDPESSLRGTFDRMHEDVVLAEPTDSGETDLVNLAVAYALEFGSRIVLTSARDDVRAPAAILY